MSTIVLAYSGGFISSNAVHWLTETHAADVVTVTLDVGQGDDLGAIRARALSCGAVRAHAIDARDELVREFLLPSLVRGPLSEGPGIAEFTRPLIARKLLGEFRVDFGQYAGCPGLEQLVEELKQTVPGFEPRWSEVEVCNSPRGSHVQHDQLGDLHFDRVSYVPEGCTFLRVLMFSPRDPQTAQVIDSIRAKSALASRAPRVPGPSRAPLGGAEPVRKPADGNSPGSTGHGCESSRPVE